MLTDEFIVQRRLRSLGLIVILSALVILWRMFDVQMIKHGHYLAMAQNQQRFEKTQMAQRGKIYVYDSISDKDKLYPLAFDVKSFSVWVVPKQISKKDIASEKLSGLIGATKESIYDLINNDKVYIPPIKRGLSLEEANKIKKEKITGVFVMPEYNRYCPEESLASHLLGFVNAEGNGMYGFEGYYDDGLKGTAGNVIGEKDTLGRVINLLEQKDAQDGTSFILTIDRGVQYFVEKQLAEAIQEYQADSGTVIVMDIKTGGIVAMASNPSYDPNNFRDYANSNPGIFVNPAIAHLYEPGSIFKPFIMGAAIEKGKVSPDTKNVFGKVVNVDGYEIHTALDKAYGEETMTQVLVNSDNVAMVWVSEQLGKEDMYKYIKSMNFLDRTGIDIDSESAGNVPELKQWRNIHRATIAFGQGITVTPMEMVAAYAMIANKGVYIRPNIVDSILYPTGDKKKIEKREGERVFSPETTEKISNMLISVVEEGSAKGAQVEGFKIAAKTGTAQIAKAGGGYEDSESKLGIYNHSLAGFAPANEPRYAMLVKLEKPKSAKYAESTAGPLFGEISSFLLNYYYRLQPSK